MKEVLNNTYLLFFYPYFFFCKNWNSEFIYEFKYEYHLTIQINIEHNIFFYLWRKQWIKNKITKFVYYFKVLGYFDISKHLLWKYPLPNWMYFILKVKKVKVKKYGISKNIYMVIFTDLRFLWNMLITV